jgi:hypothetical protein
VGVEKTNEDNWQTYLKERGHCTLAANVPMVGFEGFNDSQGFWCMI